LAGMTAELLSNEPASTEQMLKSTVDASVSKPDARKAIDRAVASRAEVMAAPVGAEPRFGRQLGTSKCRWEGLDVRNVGVMGNSGPRRGESNHPPDATSVGGKTSPPFGGVAENLSFDQQRPRLARQAWAELWYATHSGGGHRYGFKPTIVANIVNT
jgi:hypothetical protein